jgi:hypothetical protein
VIPTIEYKFIESREDQAEDKAVPAKHIKPTTTA